MGTMAPSHSPYTGSAPSDPLLLSVTGEETLCLVSHSKMKVLCEEAPAHQDRRCAGFLNRTDMKGEGTGRGCPQVTVSNCWGSCPRACPPRQTGDGEDRGRRRDGVQTGRPQVSSPLRMTHPTEAPLVQ